MRAVALTSLLLLAGCLVYGPAYGPAPGPPLAGPRRPLSEREAVDVAFRIARERGLDVDRVTGAHLDRAGRWHVELRGGGDRAKLLLDARDGRLLRGRFRERGARGGEEGWED